MLYSLPAYEYEKVCDAPEVLMMSVLLLKTCPVLAHMALLATWVTLMVCCTSSAEALATAEMMLLSLLVASLVTKLFLFARLESTLLAVLT